MGTTHRGVTRWEYLLLATLAFVVLVTFVSGKLERPGIRTPRPPESICRFALHEIGIALHNYHDTCGSFPAAISTTEFGAPPQSWRLLILPFLDKRAILERYHFDQSWDSPDNLSLQNDLPARLSFHQCPASHAPADPEGRTHYLAVVGPHTAWRTDRPVSINEVTDGTDRTILLVEVANSDVNWFEPRDLEWDRLSFRLNDPTSLSPSSKHVRPGSWVSGPVPYVNVLLVDGAVKQLPVDTPPDILKALLTIDGGETFDPPWLE